jgi:hypothetical protein
MTKRTFAVDHSRSQRKRKELENYFAKNVWNDEEGFVCLSGKMCRASALKKPDASFYEGQGQAVGSSYEFQEDGTPLRVLVIPMEYGTTRQGVSWEERSKEVEKAGGEFIQEAEPAHAWCAVNAAICYGLTVGESGATQLPSGTEAASPHLFEEYAMVNMLSCSAVKTGGMSSRSTGMMRTSCARHMRATIDTLKPTLVVSQGTGLDETLRSSLEVRKPINENVALCELDGQRFVWSSLRHPTLSWHSTKYPYFDKVVRPTIMESRLLALELG